MSYPAISLATATVGRYRCPQKRLQTARQPPVYPNSSPRIIAPVTPSPPSAALTPSIPVHRWIRDNLAAETWTLEIFGKVAVPGDIVTVITNPSIAGVYRWHGKEHTTIDLLDTFDKIPGSQAIIIK